jgi:L-ascorbate metabolism protein UlaG (beta-lactamase superfamily)
MTASEPSTRARPRASASKRRLRRWIFAFIAMDVVVLVFLLLHSTDWLATLGSSAEGTRLARMERSAHFAEGEFRNLLPTHTLTPGSFWKMISDQLGDEAREPAKPVPIVARSKRDYATPPASGLRATWIGHASVLIEIEGKRVLADPVFSDRVSPSRWLGPKRLHPPPIALAELPTIDAVVISHDHYDHLDMDTIQALAAANQDVRFLVPLGIGAHVHGWGVEPARITELDWNERANVAGLTFVATPDRHYSGRGLDRDGTLWASWVILGAQRRVFFSGDSGYFDGFAKIGAAHGPFDLTLIKIGAYGPTWPEIHMTPEQAVQTHLDLRGQVLLPIHWATFNLAPHAWSEPAERALAAARAQNVRIALPRIGEWVDIGAAVPDSPWWREVAR